MAKKLGNDSVLFHALGLLEVAGAQTLDENTRRSVFQERLSLSRVVGSNVLEAQAQCSRGQAATLSGNPTEGQLAFGEALRIADEQGNSELQIQALQELFVLAGMQRDSLKVIFYGERLLALTGQQLPSRKLALLLGALAYAHRNAGQLTRSLELSQRAVSTAATVGDSALKGQALVELAQTLIASGRVPEAISSVRRALPLLDKADSETRSRAQLILDEFGDPNS